MSVSERGGERVEKIVLGICAMDKKTSSKPMKEIMNRIEKTSIFQIKYISDKVKFEQPVETWPVVRLSPTTDHFHIINEDKSQHDLTFARSGTRAHRVFLNWFPDGKGGGLHPPPQTFLGQ